MNENFRPMKDFPKDGTRCQLKFPYGFGDGYILSQEPFFWGQEPMGKNYCIRGLTAKISPFLKPLGWRPWPETAEQKKQIEEL